MEHAEKISITISAEMLQAIRSSVGAGEYGSASAAVRDALRVWHRQRIEGAERLNAIRARIRLSLEDPNPDLTPEEVDAALDEAFACAEQARVDGPA